MLACSVHTYVKVPAVLNVLTTVSLTVSPMLAGAPAVPWKFTLCARAPNVHVTVPVRAIATNAGLNVSAVPLAMTFAVAGRVPLTVTGTSTVLVTEPRVSETVIVAEPAARPVTSPPVVTLAIDGALEVKAYPVASAIGWLVVLRACIVMVLRCPAVSVSVDGVATIEPNVVCVCPGGGSSSPFSLPEPRTAARAIGMNAVRADVRVDSCTQWGLSGAAAHASAALKLT